MSKRATDIISYLTVIGWLIAYLCGKREQSKFHLNQGLVLILVNVCWSIAYRIVHVVFSVLGFGVLNTILGLCNALISLLILALVILGLANAINGQEKPIPLLGGISLLR